MAVHNSTVFVKFSTNMLDSHTVGAVGVWKMLLLQFGKAFSVMWPEYYVLNNLVACQLVSHSII